MKVKKINIVEYCDMVDFLSEKIGKSYNDTIDQFVEEDIQYNTKVYAGEQGAYIGVLRDIIMDEMDIKKIDELLIIKG